MFFKSNNIIIDYALNEKSNENSKSFLTIITQIFFFYEKRR